MNYPIVYTKRLCIMMISGIVRVIMLCAGTALTYRSINEKCSPPRHTRDRFTFM